MKPYYEDDLTVLYNGDCRDFMASAALGNCVVVTDPPYGDTALEWDRTVPDWHEYAATVARDLWCFGSFRFWMEQAELFELAGFKYAQDLVWEKHNGSGFATDRFSRVHEHVVQWYLGPWADLHRATPKSNDATARVVKNRNIQPPHKGTIGSVPYATEEGGERLMRSVIGVRSTNGYAVHPTQKPLGILHPLIEYSCRPDGVVFDPFAGSGSTLLAARQLGRRSIGVEINPDYCAAAAKRFAQTELLVA